MNVYLVAGDANPKEKAFWSREGSPTAPGASTVWPRLVGGTRERANERRMLVGGSHPPVAGTTLCG